ncbi:response regulator transcription factor [Haliangium ochraceum]|nr:response regulator transcription factor [Haliangium ochraceum]
MARRLQPHAILADLEMPGMNGVELAEMLWLFDCPVAIALCGDQREGELVEHARALATLFPSAWTRGDLDALIDSLAQQRPAKLARGSQISLPSLAPAVSEPQPAPSAHAPDQAPRAMALRVVCSDWQQLELLCRRSEAGQRCLRLRGDYDLAPGCPLTVRLELPNGSELALAARVAPASSAATEASATPDAPAATRVHVLELDGLDREVRAFLRRSAASDPDTHGPAASARQSVHVQVAVLGARLRLAGR